ncbi:MAG: fumarate hydratase [Deltaproteobacteria bacterium]|nr:fumarate hydratase [Deltaproteobacteria bacterium]
MDQLGESLLELIRLTACDLPPDVERVLAAARDVELGRARSTLDWMLKNVAEARKMSLPICQDTGTLIFYVEHGPDWLPAEFEKTAKLAVSEATSRSFLRPNAVDPISGKNSGNNLGPGSPYFHFSQHEHVGKLKVRLMLKGGGSENCGTQYALPDNDLGAGRDMDGVKRCILDAAFKAQGFGCAPGTLGVGIGGDRMTSFLESKEQLFRSLDDLNPDPLLAELEAEMKAKVNQLQIGPMGFGGLTTVLGVKIGTRYRLPASYFVSVSYMCWAYRRRSLLIADGQASYE